MANEWFRSNLTKYSMWIVWGFTISPKRQADELAAEKQNELDLLLRIQLLEGVERQSFK